MIVAIYVVTAIVLIACVVGAVAMFFTRFD